MKDVVFKIKILYLLLVDAYRQWEDQYWRKELDERWCCDGRECGCDGVTIREVWEHQTRK